MAPTTQSSKPTSLRMVAIALAVSLLAVACAGDPARDLADEAKAVATVAPEPSPTATPPLAEPTKPPTAAPEPTPETAVEPNLFDDTFLGDVVARVRLTDGAVLVAAFGSEGMSAEASAGTDAAGIAPTSTDPFRVGSVTKVFTALATLTLVDEGAVDLDMPAVEYVSRVAVPADVTVRDLVQHTSGLFSYTNARETVAALDDPTRVWTPEEVMTAFVADRPPLFDAGSGFSYSNTNYLILGVLLEEVTGQPYHEVVRQRIIDPLDLSSSTYLASFEEGPEPFDPYEHNGAIDYDYTTIATASWAAGAMVSSASDLHLLFTALFDNQLVSAELVTQMTESDQYGYGLGLQLNNSSDGLYGHTGEIPGYSTDVRHSSELGVTVIAVSTDSVTSTLSPMRDLLRGL